MNGNKMIDIIDLVNWGIESGIYSKSTPEQWMNHFKFCLYNDLIVYIKFFNTIIGVVTWYKTDDLEGLMSEKGKYAVIAFAYIKEDYRNLVDMRKLLLSSIREALLSGKLKDVKYIVWRRSGRKSHRWKKFKLTNLLTNNCYKFRRLRWVVEEQKL